MYTATPGAARDDLLITPRRSPYRFVLIPAAVAAAVAHIPVTAAHLAEAPYIGVLFIELTAALLILAAAAVIADSTAIYLATIVVCTTAVVAYAATRTFAFPQIADDVGNWLEPLGIVSIASESVVIAAGLAALRPRRSIADGLPDTLRTVQRT
ncbi:hypothetical protein BH09ACT8_BH09ACT8_08500 [soil metagenome]